MAFPSAPRDPFAAHMATNGPLLNLTLARAALSQPLVVQPMPTFPLSASTPCSAMYVPVPVVPFRLAVLGRLESGCGWRPIARVANKLDRRLLVKPMPKANSQRSTSPASRTAVVVASGLWSVVWSVACHRTVTEQCEVRVHWQVPNHTLFDPGIRPSDVQLPQAPRAHS